MSGKEVEFLRALQGVIEDAIHNGLEFATVVETLRQNLKGIANHQFNLDAALAAGEITALNPGPLKAPRPTSGVAMSEKEVEFLRDIQGMIDYTVRNDLGFPLAVTTLGHDVNVIARYSFDLDAALADFFAPKVSGYAGSHEDSVGVPDDSNE
jgi:hypothetical protein